MSSPLRLLRQLPLVSSLNEVISNESIDEIVTTLGDLPAGFVDRLEAAQRAGTLPALLVGELDDAALARLDAEVKEHWQASTTVTVDEVSEGIVVHYHSGTGDLEDLFSTLHEPAVAARLLEVTATAEDEGVNGTRHFQLQKLLADGQVYPVLGKFALQRTQPDDCARTIVTLDWQYEENGVLGLLLDQAPQLRSLEAASAPSARFFARTSHPLTELRLSVGYDHQGFVEGLAASRCFPELATLELVDYAETYVPEWEAKRVPAEAWRALFASTGLPALRHVTLVGTSLTESDRAELLATPLGRQLESLAIRA